MPELPELEILRGNIESRLIGREITDVRVHKEPCINVPVREYREAVVRGRITGASRKGKLCLVHLSNGSTLVIHLALGGMFVHGREADFDPEDVQIAYRLDDGSALMAMKLMLGNVHVQPTKTVYQSDKRLAKMGRDALDDLPTVEEFEEWFAGSKVGAKAFLMDQSCICGLGNMYACEALFEARVHPETELRALKREDIERLHDAIPKVLKAAIAGGGASDTIWTDLEGREGTHQMRLKVFGREGEACPSCAGKIKVIRLASRATYYCPKCQRKKSVRAPRPKAKKRA
jgi:formamidopyrimidine-DNA glycosylase